MTIHLSILLFFPLVLATLGAALPRAIAPAGLLVGALVALAYAVLLLFDFDGGSDRLQYVTDDSWIAELGVRYTLGIDGLNLWLVGAHDAAVRRVRAVDLPAPAARAREALRVPPRPRRDGGAGRVPGAGPDPVRRSSST